MNAIIIAAFLFILPFTVFAEPPEEQVLEIITKSGSLLSDPIIALSKDGNTYLPLLDMGKVLGVKIEQPEELKYLVYSTESDTQTLDFTPCFKPMAGKFCDHFIKSNGTIYASTKYLEGELSWPLSLDTKEMRILIDVSLNSRAVSTKKSTEEKPIALKRELLGYPSLRAEGAYTAPEDSHTVSLYATHSLFEQDSKIFYYKKDDYSRTRWTLSKEIFDEGASSLAPKNYELVSTLTTEIKYLFSPAPIVGFNVSNRRLDENIFDTHNIYEKGPPRWKVELSVNGVYLGETVVDNDGNFSFLDVPLFYGENTLTYRFKSPLGKSTEYTQRYNISDEFEGTKRFRYLVSFGQIEQDSQYMGSAQGSYGLTPNISVQAGLAQFPLEEELKKYSSVGVSFLQPFYSLSVTRTSSVDNKESATTFAPKANLPGVLVSGEYTEFKDFQSLLINKITTNNQISLGKVSALSHVQMGFPMVIQGQFKEDRYEDSLKTQEALLRAYAMFERKSLLTEVSKAWPSASNPDLYVEYGEYYSSFRGRYGVLIQNDRYTKTKIGIESNLPYEVYLTLNLETPPNISESAYSLGLGRLFKELQVETSVTGANDKTSYGIILSTNIKTGPTRIQFTSEENYIHGQMHIHVFVDENGNGTFDDGEKPLSRVRVMQVQRQKEFETDTDGKIVIPAISPYQRISLSVIKESISNIFLTAKDFDSDFVLTPGQRLEVEIPVVPSFDVRGSLENSHYKKLIPMELIDKQGNVVATAVSAANGNYRFDDVPMGTYIIRVTNIYISANNLKASPMETTIEVSGKAGIKVATPIVLTKRK